MKYREQAREAAKTRLEDAETWLEGYLLDGADAASDVWEPLLREAVEVVNGLADQQAMPDYWYEDFLARAKEALG